MDIYGLSRAPPSLRHGRKRAIDEAFENSWRHHTSSIAVASAMWVWTCCQCGDSGMRADTTLNCPSCYYHQRCANCTVQEVPRRNKSGPPTNPGLELPRHKAQTPKFHLKHHPGTITEPAPLAVIHSTISKDHTGGEDARKAILLASYGQRLHSCEQKYHLRSRGNSFSPKTTDERPDKGKRLSNREGTTSTPRHGNFGHHDSSTDEEGYNTYEIYERLRFPPPSPPLGDEELTAIMVAEKKRAIPEEQMATDIGNMVNNNKSLQQMTPQKQQQYSVQQHQGQKRLSHRRESSLEALRNQRDEVDYLKGNQNDPIAGLAVSDKERFEVYPTPLSDVRDDLASIKQVKAGRLNNLKFARYNGTARTGTGKDNNTKTASGIFLRSYAEDDALAFGAPHWKRSRKDQGDAKVATREREPQ